MIENIYISTNGGVCLFSREYNNSTPDNGFMTGFMTSVFHMAKEATENQLEYITLKNKMVYYSIQESLIVMLVTKKNFKPKKYQKMAKKLLSTFIKCYPIDFSDKIISIQFFRGFKDKIDPLIR